MAIKRSKSAFSAYVNGSLRTVAAGDLLDGSDPVIKGREDLFEDVDTYVGRRSGVEQATAAPGERRSVQPAARPEPELAKGEPGKSGAATARRPGRSGSDRKGASS